LQLSGYREEAKAPPGSLRCAANGICVSAAVVFDYHNESRARLKAQAGAFQSSKKKLVYYSSRNSKLDLSISNIKIT
jgi:hypothetical protein